MSGITRCILFRTDIASIILPFTVVPFTVLPLCAVLLLIIGPFVVAEGTCAPCCVVHADEVVGSVFVAASVKFIINTMYLNQFHFWVRGSNSLYSSCEIILFLNAQIIN